jgi:predicted transcriptional regulator
VIKYSKKLSGQCNVTAQIEQVQDKKKIINGPAKKYFSLLKHLIAILFIFPLMFKSDIFPLNRNESGRFGALKSDSTHHFFRNACTKSGSLRFSQFSGC